MARSDRFLQVEHGGLQYRLFRLGEHSFAGCPLMKGAMSDEQKKAIADKLEEIVNLGNELRGLCGTGPGFGHLPDPQEDDEVDE